MVEVGSRGINCMVEVEGWGDVWLRWRVGAGIVWLRWRVGEMYG